MSEPWVALREQARSLLALADELEAASSDNTSSDELLDLKRLKEEFGFSRESLKSAGEKGLPVHLGAKGRLCAFRSDVVAYVKSRRWTPTKKRPESANIADHDAATLRLLQGGR